MSGRVHSRSAVTIVAGAIAALVVALPASASGSFDRHFTVLSKDVAGHETTNGFAFRSVLLNPANPANRIGNSHVRCRFDRQSRKSRCRGVFHFDGTIGGFGDLLIKGNFGGRDHTGAVVDGDGDFTGSVAGKIFVHNINRRTTLIDFDLTR
jgi:hypothetical protein